MAMRKKGGKKTGQPILEQALLLLRVSTPRQMQTDDDPEGISLPTQREACQRKARELGLTIVDEYIEPGNTGTAIAKRPVFRQMMQRIHGERDVDHIITDLDQSHEPQLERERCGAPGAGRSRCDTGLGY